MYWFFENVFLSIALVAFLMFLDYSLTIIGQKYYRKYYKKYVVIDKYELNPIFEKDVEKSKYPLKHLIGVSLLSVIIYYLFLIDDTKYIYETSVSTLFFAFLIVNINHLNNIFIFKWVSKNPDLIKGRIMYSRRFSYVSSLTSYISFFIVMLIIYSYVQNPITLGAFLASATFLIANGLWYAKLIKSDMSKKS